MFADSALRSVTSEPLSVRLRGRRDGKSEQGSGAIAAVAAIGVFLFVFAFATQMAVWQYGRGAVRSALNEAARAGAGFETGGELACQAQFDDAIAGLLGGSLGSGVQPVRCIEGTETYTAVTTVTFNEWVPVTGDWTFTVSAVAAKERLP